MFFGAIFKTVKGGYDAYTLRKKLKEYQNELTKDLLTPFSVYERYLANERLLMAEYLIELSKLQARKAGLETRIKLKERMNRRMKELIAQTQEELEGRSATKLDIARLVTGMRELSIAVDRDLASFRKEIAAEQRNLLQQLNELGERLLQLSDRIDRQANQTAHFEKKINSFFNKVKGFDEDLEKITKTSLQRIKLIWGFNIFMLLIVIYLLFR